MSRTIHNDKEEIKMIIKDKVILITGACGGIGKCLVDEFLARGAAKIYAADMSIDNLNFVMAECGDKVFPIKLDVTSREDIAVFSAFCSDVDILVNNAGVEKASKVFEERAVVLGKLEMSVNCLGLHALTAAFWGLLKAKESAVINMLSIASFVHIPSLATYCASKVAAHSITQAFRHASANTNVKVVGVYPGYVDTSMTKNIDAVKVTPQYLAKNICDDFESGILDIFPDEMSKELCSGMYHNNLTLDCKLKVANE